VKGVSPKVEGLHPTGAHADAEKSSVICGVTPGNTDYVKTQWRNPKISLVHSCLIRFARGQYRYVKSSFISL
jgi:hypothetical protein